MRAIVSKFNNFIKSIPLVGKAKDLVVPRKSVHRPINTTNNIHRDFQARSWTKNGCDSLIPYLTLNTREFEADDEFFINANDHFEKTIKDCIKRNPDVKDKINIVNASDRLLYEASMVLRFHLIKGAPQQSLADKVQELNQRNASSDEYVAAAKDYIEQAIKLMKFIERKTIGQLDFVQSRNDKDLCDVLMVNRQVSKEIATLVLDQISHAFRSENLSKGDEHFSKIYHGLQKDIVKMGLASSFGLHSDTIISFLQESLQSIDPNSNSQDLATSLQLLDKFNEATYGSVIQSEQDDKYNLGQIQEDKLYGLITQFRGKLKERVMKAITNDERGKDENRYKINEYISFFEKLARTKKEFNKYRSSLNNITLLKFLENNLKNQFIRSANYRIENQQLDNDVIKMFGTIADKNIPGLKLNLIDQKDRSIYERKSLEVALLAAFDVISEELPNYSYNHDLIDNYKRKGNDLPWIDELYQDFKHTLQIEKENQREKTAYPTAFPIKRLSGIGRELSRFKDFKGIDFIKEYSSDDDLSRLANALIDEVERFTSVGNAILPLEMFKNLFTDEIAASTETQNPSFNLSASDAANATRLIRFLQNKLRIVSKENENEEVISPRQDTIEGKARVQEKWYEMSKIFSRPEFLATFTSSIAQFWKHNLYLHQERFKATGKADGSLIDEQNLTISTLLFYFFAKYLPEIKTQADPNLSPQEIYSYNEQIKSYDCFKNRLLLFDAMMDDRLEDGYQHSKSVTNFSKHFIGGDNDRDNEVPRRGLAPALLEDFGEQMEELIIGHGILSNKINTERREHYLSQLKKFPFNKFLQMYTQLELLLTTNKKQYEKLDNDLKQTYGKGVNQYFLSLKKFIPQLAEYVPEKTIAFINETRAKYAGSDNDKHQALMKIINELKMHLEFTFIRKACDQISVNPQLKENKITIKHDDEETITAMNDIFNSLEAIGKLQDSPIKAINKAKGVRLTPEQLLEQGASGIKVNTDDLDTAFDMISKFTSSTVSLIEAKQQEHEAPAFNNQYLKKRELIENLNNSNYSFKPEFGFDIKWMSEDEHEKLKRKQSNKVIIADDTAIQSFENLKKGKEKANYRKVA